MTMNKNQGDALHIFTHYTEHIKCFVVKNPPPGCYISNFSVSFHLNCDRQPVAAAAAAALL